jgi:hypothetical protein
MINDFLFLYFCLRNTTYTYHVFLVFLRVQFCFARIYFYMDVYMLECADRQQLHGRVAARRHLGGLQERDGLT